MIGFLDSNTDVGQALTGYLHIDPNLFAMLSALSIFSTAAISIYFCKIFLELAPINVPLDSVRARSSYIRFVAVGAALFGCVLVVPFKIFPLGQAIGPVLPFLFSIPWIWAAAARTKEIKSIPNDLNENIRWQPMLLLAVLLLFFRLVLAPGITFVA